MATGGRRRELLPGSCWGGGNGDAGKASQMPFLSEKLLRKLSSRKSFSRRVGVGHQQLGTALSVGHGPPLGRWESGRTVVHGPSWPP